MPGARAPHRPCGGRAGAQRLLADPQHRHHGRNHRRALLRHRSLRVITNNLHVAHILAGNESCEVIVAGGTVRARDRAVVGQSTIDFMRQFKVDIALIGCSEHRGRGRRATLRDFDLREVKVAQTILAQGRELWLAADTSKFHRPAMVQIAPPARIDLPLHRRHAHARYEAARCGRGSLRRIKAGGGPATDPSSPGPALTDKAGLPARPRPGHLQLAQHRVRPRWAHRRHGTARAHAALPAARLGGRPDGDLAGPAVHRARRAGQAGLKASDASRR